MNRLQKKCLLASLGLHLFSLLLLVFGSAFFVSKEKDIPTPKLQFFPSKFVEAALAGGGGNPNIARTDDVQKGVPKPMPPTPVAPAPQETAKPLAVQPAEQPDPPPQPKPETRKVEKSKPEPTPVVKKPTPKPVDTAKPKPTDKPLPTTKPRIDIADLKPVTRSNDDKQKDQKEAEAREAARVAAQQRAAAAAARQRLANQILGAASSMQSGFQSCTKVDVGGPGGEAYASYGATVQAAYEDAWKIIQDLSDNDSVVIVRVVIANNGRVVGSSFVRRSGNAAMDRSIQRALDKVKLDGLPPFPDFIKDSERSFTIEFNLKAKRLLA